MLLVVIYMDLIEGKVYNNLTILKLYTCTPCLQVLSCQPTVYIGGHEAQVTHRSVSFSSGNVLHITSAFNKRQESKDHTLTIKKRNFVGLDIFLYTILCISLTECINS